MKPLLLSKLFIASLLLSFTVGCTESSFLSNGAASIKSKVLPFGGSETRSMTDVIISVDQSQSMIDVQAALADGVRDMTTALHGYPVTYHIITPTAFEQSHMQGSGSAYYDALYNRDADNNILFQLWDDRYFPDVFANPFSTVDAASIKYFDGEGKQVNAVPSGKPFRLTYGTKTLAPTAKYAILQTDSYQKALALSNQIASSVQLGAGGDSKELSMCSMFKYVRDRIMDPSSPEYRQNPLIALVNVSDENSNDEGSIYNAKASMCFETSEIEHYVRDSIKYANAEECENDPENCVDDTPKTQYSYNYYFPTMTAKCTRVVDNTSVIDEVTRTAIQLCHKSGRNLCDFPADLPTPHSYTNALDIEGVGAALGCEAGTTEWARLDTLRPSSSTATMEEHAEDREVSSFTSGGVTYQNLYDFFARRHDREVYNVYVRRSPRVTVKHQRLGRKHTFTYHNQEMKDAAEGSNAGVRAQLSGVIGRSLVDMLEEKSLGYFFAGIVTTAEDQAEREDPNASVGTAQIELADHIKDKGSFKSNSAIHSVRSSDYASFMVPAMREFVNRFALSTYDLDLEVGENLVSIGIKDKEGQVNMVEFTNDKTQADQFVAVVSEDALQFNLTKLQDLLGIDVAPGKQLSDEDLEDYSIVVHTIEG